MGNLDATFYSPVIWLSRITGVECQAIVSTPMETKTEMVKLKPKTCSLTARNKKPN